MKETKPEIDPAKIWQEIGVDPGQMSGEAVQTLATYQLTDEEIAAVFNTTAKQMMARHSGAVKRGRLIGKAALRVAQIRTAGKGNAISQIWLGKQALSQQDKPDTKHETERDSRKIRGKISQIFGESKRYTPPPTQEQPIVTDPQTPTAQSNEQPN